MLTNQKEPQLIDKNLLYKRFKSVAKTYNTNAVVQKIMAQRLVEAASYFIKDSYTNMLELGCGTGILTAEILQRFKVENYTANDLVGEFEPLILDIQNTYSKSNFSFLPGDAETINIALKQDVIWSGATIQWITELESFFCHIRSCLKTDGYFVFSTFERFNYLQIKELTGRGIEYIPLDDLLKIAEKNFKVLNSQVWEEKLWFNSPKDILKHMQYTGVNAIKCEKWNKSKYIDFIIGYQKYKEKSGYPLTYNPVLVVLQSK